MPETNDINGTFPVQIARRLPGYGLVLAAASPLFWVMGPALFHQMLNAGSPIVLILGFECAFAGFLLGLIGFFATHGEDFKERVPGLSAMALGGIMALFYSFVWFLILTPNAPL